MLTPAERRRIEEVLAGLPALHRGVLEKKLRRLSFVDGIPGQGTGLTSRVEGSDQFDITLRASLFGESLSDYLTNKEGRLFAADGSGRTVRVEASGADALTYVLLGASKESAQLLFSSKKDSPFMPASGKTVPPWPQAWLPRPRRRRCSGAARRCRSPGRKRSTTRWRARPS